MLKDNFFVSETLSSIPTRILIDEFNRRISEPLATSEEVANVYAILIALTFKNRVEVLEVFQKVSREIKFEWFSEIANIYLNDYTVFPSYSMIEAQMPPPAIQVVTTIDNFINS